MIYAEPQLHQADADVLARIREQRDRLRSLTQNNPRRWMGSLRRDAFARAIQGSNTIEGFNATMDEAVAAVEARPASEEAQTETWQALTGYRNAMTYILQTAGDASFEFSKQFLKSLHFMMTGHDLNAYPGLWRPGGVSVVNAGTGEVVYVAPDADMIDPLIGELVDYLAAGPRQSSLLTAAMAHLNLTMIHPFKDGNGRMARALQTFVLAREGIVYPLFSSIEEWLGRNTDAYYRMLADIGRGSWNPHNDALPWIRFCLRAHYQQANVLIRRTEEAEDMYDHVSGLIERHGLNARAALPLLDCASGLSLTNARYQDLAEVSQHVASRDLRLLADLGLIEPRGEKRGRHYLPGRPLTEARERIRRRELISDPYDPAHPRSG